MKTQKGITLIALIITIIVMLILVGVSVSVALNTGLFKTAQGAAKNTEAAKENETKLSNGTVNLDGEEVDINNINAYFKNKELKEQGYTHKLILPKGEEDFVCYIKEDTTFADLIEEYDEFTEATEMKYEWGDVYDVTGQGYVCFNGLLLGDARSEEQYNDDPFNVSIST